ncbi:MAG: hypothetical protein AB1657_06185 [Candidatus Micrarchaeota archaeon]
MQSGTMVLATLLFSAFLLFGCGERAPDTQFPVSGSQFPVSGSGPSFGTPPSYGGNQPPAPSYPTTAREEMVPAGAVKITPETDIYPPILHSDEYEEPVPLGPPINTKGAEDSPFIMPDGNTFYVWFTPSPAIPVEQQLLDNVTGIYVSHKVNGEWIEPERMWLVEPGELSLDGCLFVQGGEAWFCSVREGYPGINLFTARHVNGKWEGWQIVDEKLRDYEVGEMHISADGNTLYFHSPRAGGKGQLDIWYTEKVNGEWQPPINFELMNSPDNEGWPFISQDGSEFWFTRTYMGTPAIFRSKKMNGEWGTPELIVSQFAGEPTLDNAGNLYFTHHFYENGTMLEADIYVAYKK